MSQTRSLIQDNLLHSAQSIKAQKAADMKHVADHTQDAAVPPLWDGQPTARPDDDIVSERAQQQYHVLRFKTLFVAFGEAQPTLVAFQGGFDPPTTLIVKRHI